VLRAPRDVRAFGAHGRATSETGFTLDRTQHDLVGGRGAENAALIGMRFRYGWQMTRDLGIMPFPKSQGMRAASDLRGSTCSRARRIRNRKTHPAAAPCGLGRNRNLPGVRRRRSRTAVGRRMGPRHGIKGIDHSRYETACPSCLHIPPSQHRQTRLRKVRHPERGRTPAAASVGRYSLTSRSSSRARPEARRTVRASQPVAPTDATARPQIPARVSH
jgi:hypothetical protein